MSAPATSFESPDAGTESSEALFNRLLCAVESQWRGLPDKPEETPAGTVRALWFAAANQARSAERAAEGSLAALDEAGVGRLTELIGRRMSGVPLAYLTGFQRFLGLEFQTDPCALIPRKETEILGTTALSMLRHLLKERGKVTLMDLCTGSGNLAIALTVHEPLCKTFAADLCPKAVSLAQRNAERFQVRDRIEFRVGDLFAPFTEPSFVNGVDILVCNPPYISSAKVSSMPSEISNFEPALAFDAGAFGLGVLGRLIKEAPRYLRPRSWLCFELGAGQGNYLAASMERMPNYREVRRITDSKGEVRVLAALTSD